MAHPPVPLTEANMATATSAIITCAQQDRWCRQSCEARPTFCGATLPQEPELLDLWYLRRLRVKNASTAAMHCYALLCTATQKKGYSPQLACCGTAEQRSQYLPSFYGNPHLKSLNPLGKHISVTQKPEKGHQAHLWNLGQVGQILQIKGGHASGCSYIEGTCPFEQIFAETHGWKRSMLASAQSRVFETEKLQNRVNPVPSKLPQHLAIGHTLFAPSYMHHRLGNVLDIACSRVQQTDPNSGSAEGIVMSGSMFPAECGHVAETDCSSTETPACSLPIHVKPHSTTLQS